MKRPHWTAASSSVPTTATQTQQLEQKISIVVVCTLVLDFETRSPCVIQAGSTGNPPIQNQSCKTGPRLQETCCPQRARTPSQPLALEPLAKTDTLLISHSAAFRSQDQAIWPSLQAAVASSSLARPSWPYSAPQPAPWSRPPPVLSCRVWCTNFSVCSSGFEVELNLSFHFPWLICFLQAHTPHPPNSASQLLGSLMCTLDI